MLISLLLASFRGRKWPGGPGCLLTDGKVLGVVPALVPPRRASVQRHPAYTPGPALACLGNLSSSRLLGDLSTPFCPLQPLLASCYDNNSNNNYNVDDNIESVRTSQKLESTFDIKVDYPRSHPPGTTILPLKICRRMASGYNTHLDDTPALRSQLGLVKGIHPQLAVSLKSVSHATPSAEGCIFVSPFFRGKSPSTHPSIHAGSSSNNKLGVAEEEGKKVERLTPGQ